MYKVIRSVDSTVWIEVEYSETLKDGGGFTLHFNITDGESIPLELFVYQKVANQAVDTFTVVAQPYMFEDEEFPNTRPEDGYGYYRVKTAELSFTAAGDVITNRVDIMNQLTKTVQDYGEILENFSSGTETITYEETE